MQPGLGTRVTAYAGVATEILADNTTYEIITAMLKDYTHNDFRYTALVANSAFPAGALLGFGQVGGGHQLALSAGATSVATPASAVYTWTAALIANRGMGSNQNLPASESNHAVVLAKDVDIYDGGNASLDYIVPVFWRATFKPTGIIQDVTSATNQPWPVADGDTSRLSIVPGL